MGLLSWTVGLPLQPVRGVIALSQVIQRQVEAETSSPQTVRRQLEELEQAREQDPGSITEDQEREAMQEIITSRIPSAAPPGRASGQTGEGTPPDTSEGDER